MSVLRPMRTRVFALAESLWSAIPAVFSHGKAEAIEAATYFLGQTDGYASTALACVRVRCDATWGSFHVDAGEMRRVIETARVLGLQVVGQMHTHPQLAYHSDGDDEGAQIKHNGFVSVVAPDYGLHLPSLQGVRAYMYSTDRNTFIEVEHSAIRIVRAVL